MPSTGEVQTDTIEKTTGDMLGSVSVKLQPVAFATLTA